jgi:hypothetical protein
MIGDYLEKRCIKMLKEINWNQATDILFHQKESKHNYIPCFKIDSNIVYQKGGLRYSFPYQHIADLRHKILQNLYLQYAVFESSLSPDTQSIIFIRPEINEAEIYPVLSLVYNCFNSVKLIYTENMFRGITVSGVHKNASKALIESGSKNELNSFISILGCNAKSMNENDDLRLFQVDLSSSEFNNPELSKYIQDPFIFFLLDRAKMAGSTLSLPVPGYPEDEIFHNLRILSLLSCFSNVYYVRSSSSVSRGFYLQL